MTTRLALSKPPQRRHIPANCYVWLLVGTPTVLGTLLAYSLGGAQSALPDATWYLITIAICVLHFYDICTRDGCWTVISIWRFDLLIAGLVNPNGLITVVTPTDCPKSIRNLMWLHIIVESLCYFDLHKIKRITTKSGSILPQYSRKRYNMNISTLGPFKWYELNEFNFCLYFVIKTKLYT